MTSEYSEGYPNRLIQRKKSILHSDTKENTKNSIPMETFSTFSSSSPSELIAKWSYQNLMGVEWDAQPACFITDYVLAIQCFSSGLYVLFSSSGMEWYVMYFFSLGTTAGVGGFLHHVAYKALSAYQYVLKTASSSSSSSSSTTTTTIGHATKSTNMTNVTSSSSLTKTKSLKISKQDDTMISKLIEPSNSTPINMKVFGIHMSQIRADEWIDNAWRIVLGVSSLSHFSLIALSVQQYFSEHIAFTTIVIAGSCYTIFGIWSSMQMNTLFMLIGFIPALLFLGLTSLSVFTDQSIHGLIILSLKLGSGLVQSLGMSPSERFFNHNALAHVLLSFSAMFMMCHYWFA